MLKLTFSFYRWMLPTCEKISYNISHVKKFSHLSSKIKKCTSVFNQNTLLIPFIHTTQKWQQLSNMSKRLHTNEPNSKSNAGKKIKQMSDSFQPTLNHVSYGGQFEVVSDDENNSWIQFEETETIENNDINDNRKVHSDFRIWEPAGTWNNLSDVSGNSFKFKVVSYNVLAQYLLECHPYLYTQCSPQDLKWKVRAARLYDEILNLEPDILCLQEVQASHIESFYSKFEHIGYCGVFKQKTGHRQDGCAIYFKRSMFHLEDHISVEFFQPELPLLNRDNVGLVLRLRPHSVAPSTVPPAPPLVVATTHLLYNPKRTDVRLAQMQLFLAEIDRFAYYHNGIYSGHHPIILTGDFNSPPNSAVIKLLSSGHVSAGQFRDSSDWRRIGVTDNCQHLSVFLNRSKGIETDSSMIKIYNSDRSPSMPNIQEATEASGQRDDNMVDEKAKEAASEHGDLFNSGELEHGLRLSSVYGQQKEDGSREATTFQTYWTTVDYMYFSRCRALKLLKRLRLPAESQCLEMGPLPNSVYASDHLALAALFELKPPNANL